MFLYKGLETSSLNDDYILLNFLTQRTKVETSNLGFITKMTFSGNKVMEMLIKWLSKEKVVNENGDIVKEKLDIFYQKYNENITERTIR